MWELGHKEGWAPKNWCFWTVVLEEHPTPLSIPWTARRSNQSILKEMSPEYSLEGLMLKLKLQYFGHLMQRADSLGKTLMVGKTEAGGEGDGRGWDGWVASLIQWTWIWATPGASGGQRILACCSPWGGKVGQDLATKHKKQSYPKDCKQRKRPLKISYNKRKMYLTWHVGAFKVIW